MIFHMAYGALLALRFGLQLIGQTSYIHPDEFHQTVEAIADEIMNYETDPPWEFTVSSPIRSRAIIAVFLSIPLRLVLAISKYICPEITHIDLLTLCRMWTTACSLVTDWAVVTLSHFCSIDPRLPLLLHASSAVSLVFLTRTFSNTWETQLVALFTCLAFSCLSPIINNRKNLEVRVIDYRILIGFAMGAIVSFGLFCRPTFVAFIFPMVVFKCLIDYYYSSHSNRYLWWQVALFTAGFTSVTVILISADSLIYNKLTSGIDCYQEFFRCLVIAPYNFIAYNTNTSNLAQHGSHKRYTHILVNVPLLIGVPLASLVLIVPLIIIYRLINRSVVYSLSSLLSSPLLFLMSVVFMPLLSLSVFPHQEMRFLLPCSPALLVLACAVLDRITSRISRRVTIILIGVHFLFNLASIIFWGYLHEGGLVRAAGLIRHSIHSSDRFSNRISSSLNHTHVVVSYRCLLLPKFLLEINQSRESSSDSVSLINMMGRDESLFWRDIQFIVSETNRLRGGYILLHLVYPRSYGFTEPENFQKLGSVKSAIIIPGHINTDLFPPSVPLSDFFSLQYTTFSVNSF